MNFTDAESRHFYFHFTLDIIIYGFTAFELPRSRQLVKGHASRSRSYHLTIYAPSWDGNNAILAVSHYAAAQMGSCMTHIPCFIGPHANLRLAFH